MKKKCQGVEMTRKEETTTIDAKEEDDEQEGKGRLWRVVCFQMIKDIILTKYGEDKRAWKTKVVKTRRKKDVAVIEAKGRPWWI